MIKLYTWTTPNGYKPLILLEELGIEYELIPINIGEGDQKTEEFLAINPNGRIPALIDEDPQNDAPIRVFESGAIMIYLAEKYGEFLPKEGAERAETLAWLMFQMGGVGPMFGQAYHFKFSAPEGNAYGQKRYLDETKRLIQVLEHRLNESSFLGGDTYGIADMITWPWVRDLSAFGISWDSAPALKAWVDRIAARPAVQKAMSAPIKKS